MSLSFQRILQVLQLMHQNLQRKREKERKKLSSYYMYVSLSLSCRPHPASVAPHSPVHSLLSYSKGFMCSSGCGTVHLFEKTEEKNNFKKVRSVSIWIDPGSGITSDQSKHDIDSGKC